MPHSRHEPGIFTSENGHNPPAPAQPCVAVDPAIIRSFEIRLEAVEKQGEQVLNAIVGHPAIGHTGLVGRQDRLEVQLQELRQSHEKNDRKLFRFGTIMTLFGAILVFAKDLIVSWITNPPHKP